MNIVLIGAPASGKGTLTEQLIQKYNISATSTGDLLRQEIDKQTPIGIQIEQLLSKGCFAPNEITNSIMEQYIKEHTSNDIVFDGYPRNEEQALFCDSILTTLNQKIDLVIVIEVSDDIAIKRITNRRICPTCHRIGTTKDQGICPACGTPQTKRDDDTPTVAKNRIETYLKTTKPIIDYYSHKQDCQVTFIDGNQDPDQTFNQVETILNDRLKPRH